MGERFQVYLVRERMVRVGREFREEMISEGKLGNRYCRWSLPASHSYSGRRHPGELSRGLTWHPVSPPAILQRQQLQLRAMVHRGRNTEMLKPESAQTGKAARHTATRMNWHSYWPHCLSTRVCCFLFFVF